MDSPLTLKTFMLTLLACVFVAMVPVGYAWTTVTSDLENLNYRIKTIKTQIGQIQECEQAKSIIAANKDRIHRADERISELQTVVDACSAALREHETESETGD